MATTGRCTNAAEFVRNLKSLLFKNGCMITGYMFLWDETSREILRDIANADDNNLQGYVEEAKLLYLQGQPVVQPVLNCEECYFFRTYGKCQNICKKLKAHKVQGI